MILAAVIVAIIGLVAALFLAVRGLRGHGLGFERTAGMAVAWVVIIAALALILTRMAG